MARAMTPFLMFQGAAGEAVDLYVSLFGDSGIRRLERYGPGEPGAEGSVTRADITVAGRELICIGSPVEHDFGFTPAVSLFVECDDETELQAAFERLSAAGEVLMPLDDYGFSRRFGWVNDRFGVSWQLNLS